MKRIIDAVLKVKEISVPQDDSFEFHDPGALRDGELELVLFRTLSGNPDRGDVPTYRFKIMQVDSDREVGRIDLRIGNTERIIKYLGHIGYHVGSRYRGNHYAARAWALLLPLARSHGLEKLWITCNPDNIASRRTCDLVGAEFVEIVDVPKGTDFYRAGEKQKCRYRLDL